MFRLWNYLFGWDYIYWTNSASNGVARVFVNDDGDAYYCRYKTTQVYDRVKSKDQVIWLTCSSKKYIETY